jgi:hypothetical protein
MTSAAAAHDATAFTLFGAVRRHSTMIGWCVLAALCVLFAAEQVNIGIGRSTSDSPSYLRLALGFQQSGIIEFDAWREYGYQGFILALSRILPWQTEIGLMRWMAGFQVAAYVSLFATFVVIAVRSGGPWWAVLVALPFAIDPFNALWVAQVMSEAPAELMALSGVLCLLWWWRTRRRIALVIAALLAGAIPLFRAADLAIPLSAAGGVALWWIMRPRLNRLPGVVGLVALLVGPTLIFCAVQKHRTGFFGLTARGADQVAARFVTLADPDKVLASGVAPDLVEKVFRPIYRAWNPLAGQHGILAPGSPEHFYPVTRGRQWLEAGAPALEQVVAAYLREKGQPENAYTVAALSASLVPMAFKADPQPILVSIALITWDFARLPFVWNYWHEAYAWIYIWPLLWIGLLIYIWRHGRSYPDVVAVTATAIVMLPAYWVSISLGTPYSPRYSTHLYLIVTMMLIAAALTTYRVAIGLSPSEMDNRPQS